MQITLETTALSGVQASPVSVQCQIAAGLPCFQIVGMADRAVSEAKERVRAALYSLGIAMPPKRVLINLAPAHMPKIGNHYDLAIALAVMAALEIISADEAERYVILGELSLFGEIKPVAGVLAAALMAADTGKDLICPAANYEEAMIAREVDILGADHLNSVLEHFRTGKSLTRPKIKSPEPDATLMGKDMRRIKGQHKAKRALEIAAAGRHHCLMLGPPGAGKSLLADSMASIMPAMTANEVLETTLIHSVAGRLTEGGMIHARPFFAPHHNASSTSIVGGGRFAAPGAISLAHNGVLFLDEIPEFSRDVLETLRQPLEAGEVHIARAHAHVSYPARFLLIAAANPCSCGMLYSEQKACARAPECGSQYLSRLSGPLMDRFTLRIKVDAIPITELASMKEGAPSKDIKARVVAARARQSARNGEGVCNEDLDAITLDGMIGDAPEVKACITQAADSLSLSPRGYYRLIKMARTIADLDGADAIARPHITEAIAYRSVG